MIAPLHGREMEEIEANIFAANLLMPMAQYRAEWERIGGSVPSVARHFGVSPGDARTRASHLNFVERRADA